MAYMKRKQLLLSGYTVPECLVLDIEPEEMLCVSQGGTLDGFEEEDDDEFFN